MRRSLGQSLEKVKRWRAKIGREVRSGVRACQRREAAEAFLAEEGLRAGGKGS